MLFQKAAYLAVALATSLCYATPTPVLSPATDDHSALLVREGINLARSNEIEKRMSAEFSMERSWSNEVLVGGGWIGIQEEVSESVALSISCLDCYTKGTVTASLTDKDLIKPRVRLDFEDVEAYAFLGVKVSAAGVYSLNLFASETPCGLGFLGIDVGVVFFVDLVFSISESIDLTGGFYVKLANDAYLEADIFGGDIVDSFFEGMTSKSLPVTVEVGAATFKADLRLRVQCGAEVQDSLLGIGGSAELGIYANLIEFETQIQSTPECGLQTTEWWDLNVGAYAHLDVVIDYKTIGPVPTVSTTLLSAPTATQCLIKGPAASGVIVGGGSGVASASGAASIVASASGSGSGSGIASFSFSPFVSSAGSTATGSVGGTASVPTITSPPTISATAGSQTSSTYKYALTNSSSVDSAGLVTSTLYSTTVYTITSCAASVVNCPASSQSVVLVTQTVDAYTTVCPATASVTPTFTSSKAASTSSAAPIAYTTVTNVVTLTPCATPVVATFAPNTTVTQTATIAASTPAASSSASTAAATTVQTVIPVVPVKQETTTATSTSVATAYLTNYPSAAGTSSKWTNGTAAYTTVPASSKPSSTIVASYSSVPTQTPITAGAARSAAGGLISLVLTAVGVVLFL